MRALAKKTSFVLCVTQKWSKFVALLLERPYIIFTPVTHRKNNKFTDHYLNSVNRRVCVLYVYVCIYWELE